MDETIESLKAALAVAEKEREKAEAERDEARRALRDIGVRAATIECGAHHGRLNADCTTCRDIAFIQSVTAGGDKAKEWSLRHESRTLRDALAAAQKRIEALEGALHKIDKQCAEGFVVCSECGHDESMEDLDIRFTVKDALNPALASPSESAPQPTPETRVDLEELSRLLHADWEALRVRSVPLFNGVMNAIAELRARQAAPTGQRPFDKQAADALADEVAVLVRRGTIDQRSRAADALLDYRNPPLSERSEKIAAELAKAPQPKCPTCGHEPFAAPTGQQQEAGAAPPAAPPERAWLVWSYEHDAWWGPNHCGYYKDRARAGRYTFAQADQIVRNANYGGRRNEAAIQDEPAAAPPSAPQEAAWRVNVGETYRHYKGVRYVVLGVALESTNERPRERVVIYRSSDGPLNVRDERQFTEWLADAGCYRFKPVRPEEQLPSAPQEGLFKEGALAMREMAAQRFDDDADRFMAEAQRALESDLTVLAKMNVSLADECRREAAVIRALPLPERALLTKAAPPDGVRVVLGESRPVRPEDIAPPYHEDEDAAPLTQPAVPEKEHDNGSQSEVQGPQRHGAAGLESASDLRGVGPGLHGQRGEQGVLRGDAERIDQPHDPESSGGAVVQAEHGSLRGLHGGEVATPGVTLKEGVAPARDCLVCPNRAVRGLDFKDGALWCWRHGPFYDSDLFFPQRVAAPAPVETRLNKEDGDGA